MYSVDEESPKTLAESVDGKTPLSVRADNEPNILHEGDNDSAGSASSKGPDTAGVGVRTTLYRSDTQASPEDESGLPKFYTQIRDSNRFEYLKKQADDANIVGVECQVVQDEKTIAAEGTALTLRFRLETNPSGLETSSQGTFEVYSGLTNVMQRELEKEPDEELNQLEIPIDSSTAVHRVHYIPPSDPERQLTEEEVAATTHHLYSIAQCVSVPNELRNLIWYSEDEGQADQLPMIKDLSKATQHLKGLGLLDYMDWRLTEAIGREFSNTRYTADSATAWRKNYESEIRSTRTNMVISAIQALRRQSSENGNDTLILNVSL